MSHFVLCWTKVFRGLVSVFLGIVLQIEKKQTYYCVLNVCKFGSLCHCCWELMLQMSSMAQFTVGLWRNFHSISSCQTHFSSLVVRLMHSLAFPLSPMLFLCSRTWLEMLCRWAVCVPSAVLPCCVLTTAANSVAACILFWVHSHRKKPSGFNVIRFQLQSIIIWWTVRYWSLNSSDPFWTCICC